jgi:hypothetical protein
MADNTPKNEKEEKVEKPEKATPKSGK